MTNETLKRLLNSACELLIIFEDSGTATQEDKDKIAVIFNEIKYSDRIDGEMKMIFNEIKYSDRIDDEMKMSADDEAQDYYTFGKHKI